MSLFVARKRESTCFVTSSGVVFPVRIGGVVVVTVFSFLGLILYTPRPRVSFVSPEVF